MIVRQVQSQDPTNEMWRTKSKNEKGTGTEKQTMHSLERPDSNEMTDVCLFAQWQTRSEQPTTYAIGKRAEGVHPNIAS